MNIPIIINNLNRLSCTRQLVLDLIDRGYDDIYILDMGSSYEPLLEWYSYMEANEIVKILYSESNSGHRSLWEDHIIDHFHNYPWIVYTDSDIILNPDIPYKFINNMIDILDHSVIKKIGLALEINDLPNNELCNLIRSIEKRYWLKPTIYKDLELYIAPVDTTFAVIDPRKPYDYGAIRIAAEYTCKHEPWYRDWNNLDKEMQFYLDHADPKISTYTQHYLNWKNKKSL